MTRHSDGRRKHTGQQTFAPGLNRAVAGLSVATGLMSVGGVRRVR